MTIETEALRREIEGLSIHPQTRRYTPELQARVLAWARGREAAGASVPGMCLEIGIGDPTLRRFLGLARLPRAAKRKRPGFARVKLVSPAPQTLVVRGPCGVAVEGLSLEGIAELFKRLACSA